MERKRKLPARAAARVEHASKKRNSSTPPELSTTSAPPPPEPTEPIFPDPPPPPAAAALPSSLQPGHPLPTVEKPQPDDLSHAEFQSIQESGVMAESLSRSRQKWIHDGIFEKYWTKPSKRKGAVKEESNNPAKDTMTKIGQVTITVEPHVLEATMYAVKDPKPVPATNPAIRPIIQYGPPNGAMPPPPMPTTTSTTAASPSPATVLSPSKPPAQAAALPSQAVRPSPQPIIPPPKADEKLPAQQLPPTPAAPPSASPSSQQTELQRPQLSATFDNNPVVSPRGLESVLAAPQPAHAPVPAPAHPRPPQPPLSQPPPSSNHPLHAPGASPNPFSTSTSLPAGSVVGAKTTTPASKPVPAPAPGADPIIVTLAEKASEDPHLRDLMKRVAVGEAAAHELAHFQRIIDQITLEYKKKGVGQGPSADRLIVGGRTVKYFADEVRTILDIVLASNPTQRPNDLRSPPGSDPLVILLVKEALDKPDIKTMVQRIAEGKTKFADAIELKAILDRLNTVVKHNAKAQAAATANPQATPQTTPTQVKGEDEHGGPLPGVASKKTSVSTPAQSQSAPASQQALRSKGPPPATKPDIAAVVLEFAGGTGDRYLFPKYSILEFSAEGTQVVASFLIVRKGSKLEYGGDPALDYYQPVTLRLHSHSPKVLENLARVVAPQDEVQRYMDDVMENMTRAEYVLLAMRLPRAEKEDPMDERLDTPRASELSHPSQPLGVLWDSRPTSTRPASARPASAKPTGEDDHYQSFIATVSQKPTG
ncbi:hypothetical protein HD806DRAFT_522979 [Xylariaceae sp. AK1471]|nr:hypothetical protein HD806DRAFT_522979 [Xylariaceae sp. AK1471]